MATKRTKSRKDIINQYNRINDLRKYLADRDGRRAAQGINDWEAYKDAYNRGAARANARDDKAFEITKRYVDNIQNSKSYQNAKNKAAANPSQKFKLRSKAHNRQYSQRTYMGLSNG